MSTQDYGLGRKVEFDDRSRQYPARALLAEALPLERKVWRRPLALDQGSSSACTGFDAWGRANTQTLTATIPYATRRRFTPYEIYAGAQTLDEWEGEDYDGSSVLGAAKWMKAQGVITEYRWCFGIDDVLQTLSHYGAVGFGTNWYYSMFQAPNTSTTTRNPVAINVDPSSGMAGGHAYEAHGILPGRELVVCTNSWGPAWGDEGRFYLSFSDLDALLKDFGEAVTYVR